jgi:hypothetical protein
VGFAQLATDSIEIVKRALERGLAEKGEKAVVWADKSDYKDFIRMYVISDYFKGLSEKERLGEIYGILESHGAKGLIGKISLCIGMTKREFDKEFGGPVEKVFLGALDQVYRGTKPRPRLRRLAGAHSKS